MLIIAHRGESYDAPENTLASFQLAWKRRDRAIELDIHLTKDEQLAVCHDANTLRTSGVSLDIRDCTMEELKKWDVGGWKGEKWAGERMPILKEALLAIPKRRICIIEVKVGTEIIPALKRDIQSVSIDPNQVVIISFNPEVLRESRKALPDIKTYLLSAFRFSEERGKWSPTVDELITQAKDIRADGLNLAAQPPLDSAFADRVRKAGLELFVWTVDSLDLAQRMADLGVDGMASNRAAWLRRNLKARTNASVS
jgi:glycerophosphoryl diester phosphodiesterase